MVYLCSEGGHEFPLFHRVNDVKMGVLQNEVLRFVISVHLHNRCSVLSVVEGMLSVEKHVQFFCYFNVMGIYLGGFYANAELSFVLFQPQYRLVEGRQNFILPILHVLLLNYTCPLFQPLCHRFRYCLHITTITIFFIVFSISALALPAGPLLKFKIKFSHSSTEGFT